MISDIKQEKDWPKKCKLILQFHENEKADHPDKRNEKWTIKDTADELDYSVGYVSESIKLAKALQDNEVLGKFSREAALKVLKTKL